MRSGITFVILFSLYALSDAQNPEGSFIANTISKSLTLNQEFVDYINNQTEADKANQVIIFADSILAEENVTFEHVDLIFISNYFSTGDKEISVAPESRDTTRKNLPGHTGRTVHVIAGKIDKIKFHIPGGSGLDGERGRNGKNGKKRETKRTADGGSPGTPGQDGRPGGNGGDGGNLIVRSFDDEYDITFRAPGGQGGKGGEGGKGGISYVSQISKIIKPRKNEPVEQVVYTITTRREKNGRKGYNGKRGTAGKHSEEFMDTDAFNKQVRHLLSVDPTVLEKTGWQIILNGSNDI